jgi:hypothetical protein
MLHLDWWLGKKLTAGDNDFDEELALFGLKDRERDLGQRPPDFYESDNILSGYFRTEEMNGEKFFLR